MNFFIKLISKLIFVFKSCIHYAARKGHIKVLEYLIIEKNVSPNLNSSVGATILHDAAATSRVETIEWILKNTNMKITIKDFDGLIFN